jgi:hypothetical protein
MMMNDFFIYIYLFLFLFLLFLYQLDLRLRVSIFVTEFNKLNWKSCYLLFLGGFFQHSTVYGLFAKEEKNGWCRQAKIKDSCKRGQAIAGTFHELY